MEIFIFLKRNVRDVGSATEEFFIYIQSKLQGASDYFNWIWKRESGHDTEIEFGNEQMDKTSEHALQAGQH